jgi:transcription antitermination protein NusB
MAVRRQARECAVQLLFQLDMNPNNDLTATFKAFWDMNDRVNDPRIRGFAEALVRGTREHLAAIDSTIKKSAEHWDIKRMGVIDRNVMRLSIYEMLFCPDIPPAVSINEAVDIAKYFSCRESGRFVNGILDRIRKDIKKEAPNTPERKSPA